MWNDGGMHERKQAYYEIKSERRCSSWVLRGHAELRFIPRTGCSPERLLAFFVGDRTVVVRDA